MILRASVEDTPETAGKFAKKLPAFRNILIEVGRNADNRLYEWKPIRMEANTLNRIQNAIDIWITGEKRKKVKVMRLRKL